MDFHISVIIPSFNRAHTLPRALDSVLAQTCKPREILVVDDGSKDNTQALLQQNYPQVRCIVHEFNRGVSAARNTGLAKATGNWIALLDSDDAWLPDKLEAQVTLLQQNPHYRVCHTDEIWFRNGKRINPMHKHRKLGGRLFKPSLALCLISPSSVLFHQSIYQQIGEFDPTMLACEDYDYWLRLCSRYEVLFVDMPLLIKYGGHADQLSKKFWGMDRMRIRAIQRVLAAGNLSAIEYEAAVQTVMQKCEVLLKGARKRNKVSTIQYYSRLLNHYKCESGMKVSL